MPPLSRRRWWITARRSARTMRLVPDRGHPEVVGELGSGVHGPRRRREHLDHDDRVRRGHGVVRHPKRAQCPMVEVVGPSALGQGALVEPDLGGRRITGETTGPGRSGLPGAARRAPGSTATSPAPACSRPSPGPARAPGRAGRGGPAGTGGDGQAPRVLAHSPSGRGILARMGSGWRAMAFTKGPSATTTRAAPTASAKAIYNVS